MGGFGGLRGRVALIVNICCWPRRPAEDSVSGFGGFRGRVAVINMVAFISNVALMII